MAAIATTTTMISDGDQVFRQQDRHAQARSVIRIRRLNR
jgi:hypothetical protein